ncbi:hypothetical protein BBQ_4936 [Burkholderia pseudomallei MSHR511]|nr:hypothetical protein BBS_4892 [Burkholderia pseudomallei NAU20B-16]AHG36409.1 hypothetical protein BBQ_4936 [Burkholderia pseudomallei MSHR511]AHG70036.1 hypothetical protein BBN_4660 [Burkholderia pseudomallei MSHR146]AJX20538.1 hypothetical protein BG17_5064 [Burkholderia pseudomallei MSHR491]
MGPARLQSAQRPEYDRRRNALRAARRPGVEPAGPGASARRARVRAPASRSRDKRSARRNGRRRVRACRRSHEPLAIAACAIAARARKQPMAGGRGNVGAPPCRGPPKCRRRMRRIEGAPIATHCSPLRSSRPLRPIAPIAVARAPESAKPRRRPDRAAHMLRRHTASPPLRLTTSLPIPSSPRPLTALRPQPTPIVRRNADPDQKVSAADFF